MSRIDRTMAKYLDKKKASLRLNTRLPADLLRWAKEYARRRNSTVTQIIVDHLRSLRDKDIEVPQI